MRPSTGMLTCPKKQNVPFFHARECRGHRSTPQGNARETPSPSRLAVARPLPARRRRRSTKSYFVRSRKNCRRPPVATSSSLLFGVGISTAQTPPHDFISLRCRQRLRNQASRTSEPICGRLPSSNNLALTQLRRRLPSFQALSVSPAPRSQLRTPRRFRRFLLTDFPSRTTLPASVGSPGWFFALGLSGRLPPDCRFD